MVFTLLEYEYKPWGPIVLDKGCCVESSEAARLGVDWCRLELA